MADDEGVVNLGKWRPRARPVFMVLLLLIAVAAGVVGVVVHDELVVLAANSGLLVAFVLYVVDHTVRAEQKAKQIHIDIGRIEQLRGPEHIYDLGMAALDRAQSEGRWDSLRIYAPTGLWDESAKKMLWLARLRDGLGPDVGEVRGVYGLPEEESTFHRVVEERLKLFSDHPKARLHFLPPPVEGHPCSAPAFGILIFQRDDDYLMYFACSGSTSGPIAGSGFGIEAKDLGREVAAWFDEHILHGVSAPYVLQGPGGNGRKVSLADGLKRAERLYRARTGSGRVTDDYGEFYATSTELVRNADKVIRDLVFGVAPEVSRKWLDAVADQLAKARRAGRGLRFEVLLAVDLANQGESFIKFNDEILDLFDKRGIRQNVSLHLIDMAPAIGLDLLIIDRRHLAINVTPVEDGYKRQSAFFEDRADLAEPLCDWFEQLMRRKGVIKYEDWRDEHEARKATT